MSDIDDPRSYQVTEKGLAAARHILRRYEAGASIEEIAADLQMPPEAVQLLFAIANETGVI